MTLNKQPTLNSTGFTLIELMIAVAIVGILAAIAVPSYQESVKKSRRADAQGALMNFANAMERHFTETNSYCDGSQWGQAVANCGVDGVFDQGGEPNPNIFVPPLQTRQYYDFRIITATPISYVLQAIPIATEAQVGNGLLQLDSLGNRGWDRDNSSVIDAGENTWD